MILNNIATLEYWSIEKINLGVLDIGAVEYGGCVLVYCQSESYTCDWTGAWSWAAGWRQQPHLMPDA